MNQQYTLIGVKIAEFKTKEGEQLKYCKLYVTFEDDKTVGYACEAITVKPQLADGLQIDDVLNLFYNKFGKVIDIKVL